MSIAEPQMSVENLQPQGNAAAAESAGLNSKPSTKWTNPDVADLTQVAGDMTSVLGTFNEVLGGDSSMNNTYGGLGAVMSFANCLASGDNIAESTEGSVASCLAKTGIDQIPGTPLDLVNTINGYMDVDNPAKLFTQVTSDLNPIANTKTALKSGVDTANLVYTAVNGNQAESYRKAENLEERNRNGENTVVAKALQMGVDLVNGDTEHLTDNKAERGDRGVYSAYSNAAGDYMADAIHGERGRATWRNFDEVKAEHDNMKWYKPWTW